MIGRDLIPSLVAACLLTLSVPGAAPAQPAEAPIYGQQLMSQEEREQYRARMRELATEEERVALREAHRREMQARARERGVGLPDVAAPGGAAKPEDPAAEGADAPGRGPLRGRALMTEEEWQAHRREMRSKSSPEEREQARREHHEEMQERAREQNTEIPDEPMPRRGRGPGGTGPSGPRQRGGP